MEEEQQQQQNNKFSHKFSNFSIKTLMHIVFIYNIKIKDVIAKQWQKGITYKFI